MVPNGASIGSCYLDDVNALRSTRYNMMAILISSGPFWFTNHDLHTSLQIPRIQSFVSSAYLRLESAVANWPSGVACLGRCGLGADIRSRDDIVVCSEMRALNSKSQDDSIRYSFPVGGHESSAFRYCRAMCIRRGCECHNLFTGLAEQLATKKGRPEGRPFVAPSSEQSGVTSQSRHFARSNQAPRLPSRRLSSKYHFHRCEIVWERYRRVPTFGVSQG